MIRNVFDQYSQPENRLTHALVQALANDQRLTRHFVRFAVGVDPPEGSLTLSCQVFPGEQQPVSEEEAERRGIPDLWICSGQDGWAVACECKVTATPTTDQLRRHAATARRLGFKSARLLMITPDESRPSAVPNRVNGLPVAWTSWAQLFEFFSRHARDGLLIAEFLDYLRVVEGHLMAEGYEGSSLTKFAGIPFGPGHPYTESEAKVILRALMAEVRPRLAGSSVLGIEPRIRRSTLVAAWDTVGFKDATDGEISFDVGTLFVAGRKSQVKRVPAWLDAMHAVLAQTARANFEMSLQARYPLRDGSLTRKPEFVGALVRTAETFQPFVTFLLEGRTRQKAR